MRILDGGTPPPISCQAQPHRTPTPQISFGSHLRTLTPGFTQTMSNLGLQFTFGILNNVKITDTLIVNVRVAHSPSPETLLSDLPQVRLAEVARLYGVALPGKSLEEQVTHLLKTVDVKLGTLLGRLTREELRRACRNHGLDDAARSRTELANSLLGRD